MKKTIMLLLIAPSILAADVATDRVYKWQDDNGGIHYSSAPPPTNTRSTHARLDSGELIIFEPKVADTAIKQHLVENNKNSQISMYCHKLKNNLITLYKNKRVRVRDFNGQFVELDEAAKKGKITEVTSFLKKHCRNVEAD